MPKNKKKPVLETTPRATMSESDIHNAWDQVTDRLVRRIAYCVISAHEELEQSYRPSVDEETSTDTGDFTETFHSLFITECEDHKIPKPLVYPIVAAYNQGDLALLAWARAVVNPYPPELRTAFPGCFPKNIPVPMTSKTKTLKIGAAGKPKKKRKNNG